MYLLDTSVVSELRRLDRAAEHVRRWSQRIAGAPLFLSAITIMEIELGILRIEGRDPSRAATLRS